MAWCSGVRGKDRLATVVEMVHPLRFALSEARLLRTAAQ